MNTKVIREYIELLLSERTRSSSKQRFNINKFKNFDEVVDAYVYADDTLEYLGHGSSRIVFVLSSSKVLKIAHPEAVEKGRAQNEAELKTFQNLRDKSIVSKMFDHADNFDWMISELVRPLSDESEFNTALELNDNMSYVDLVQLAEQYGADADIILQEENVEISDKAQRFLQSCVELQHGHNVLVFDMEKLSSWGKTADDRIVLLDYGYTLDVGVKHYLKKGSAAEE